MPHVVPLLAAEKIEGEGQMPKGLDATYTDFFGNVKTVAQREDFQLNKFFLPFSGWFLDERFRYYLYVWSANTAQGEAVQDNSIVLGEWIVGK